LREPFSDAAPPTAALGDWYVHLVLYGRKQIVLATSERSLLTVLLPARDLSDTLVPNLLTAVAQLLIALEIPPDVVNREIGAMQPVAFGKGANRSVLGSLNQFAFELGIYLERTSEDALEFALRFSRTSMSAIGVRSHLGFPRDVARGLLAAQYAEAAWRH
jgi:hypothetical protein